MKKGDVQYRAFISYSHADKRVAEWLHRALETYRIPAKLVGTETPLGPVPARLGRFFRDRDELPASGDLSAELTQALRHSMFLVVICSPSSAQSRWVNEEVRQFKLLHGKKRGDGTARVLALIADGDPGDAGAGACFPPALRFHVLPDGRISDDPAEPIAADLRPGGDGKRLALMKLVAGLTGLHLDALVQREAARRQRRAALLSGASLVLAGVMAVLTVLAVQGRREAERQRAQADGLVEYMLTDLREKLEPVGRLEVLDSVGQRALAYYAAQDISALDPDALGRRARALHLVGEVRELRGDSAGSLAAYRAANAATGELLAREPDDPERIFDHSQSVFYVMNAERQRFNAKDAEALAREYLALTQQLAPMDRKNSLWQSELASGHLNLGVLLLEGGRLREAAIQFEKALPLFETLARANPTDRQAQLWLGTALAWSAESDYRRGRLDSAEAARAREAAIYSRLLERDEEDAGALEQLHVTHFKRAEIQLLKGNGHEAWGHANEALLLATVLSKQDPTSEDFVVNVGNAKLLVLKADAVRFGRADAAAMEAVARGAEARNVADLSKRRVAKLASDAWTWAADAHLSSGRVTAARNTAANAVGLASKLRIADPLDVELRNIQVHALIVAAKARARVGNATEAAHLLAEARRIVDNAGDVDALRLGHRAATAAGDAATARRIGERLDEMGITVASTG